ncbi:MAG: hypothetical protein KBD52_01815 [Candidatus Pacebacteria bacterium]|nr:hypothetical protein [Candidatus Paceibacterota bacterium]
MFAKILHFVKYHNFFSIGFTILFGGLSVSLAASPTLQKSVYNSTETITSVDNTKIVSTNLDNFNFNLRINSVKDDEKSYYIDYSYKTLSIKNSVWQEINLSKTLTVSKESLGERDLGLYVASELGDNINYELSYLKDAQKLQKNNGMSKKVVTTEYSGLIGKMLDPKEKVIEGYDPVIPPPVIEVVVEEEVPIVASPILTPEISEKQEEQVVTPPPSTEQNLTTNSTLDEQAVILLIEKMLAESQNQNSGSSSSSSSGNSEPDPIPEPDPEVLEENPTPAEEVPETIPEEEIIPEPTPEPPASEPIPEIIPEVITGTTSTF